MNKTSGEAPTKGATFEVEASRLFSDFIRCIHAKLTASTHMLENLPAFHVDTYKASKSRISEDILKPNKNHRILNFHSSEMTFWKYYSSTKTKPKIDIIRFTDVKTCTVYT